MSVKKQAFLLIQQTGGDETDDAPGRIINVPEGITAVLYLDVTALSGTTPDLSGDLEVVDPISGQTYSLFSITPLAAPGKERIVTNLADFPDMKVRFNPTVTGTGVSLSYTVTLVVGG